MTTLSVGDFRSNLAASLNLVDQGELLFLRRHNKVYAIVLVDDDDLTVSPQLAEKIATARSEFQERKTLAFENATSAQKWMDEL